MDLDALRGLDAGLAFRAVEEVEDDTGSGPALLQSLKLTVDVEDVAAFQKNGGGLVQTLDHANVTPVIAVFPSGRLLVFLDTFSVETGQTLSLAARATAVVAAGKHLIARLLHQLHAVRLTAHLPKSRLH
jgi:hypothetical protein